MNDATASLRSSRPVNGSQLLPSYVSIAALVASIAAAGGRRSVSRFSMRRTSVSSPAAAATRSILKPGMSSRRLTAIGSSVLHPDEAHLHLGQIDRLERPQLG